MSSFIQLYDINGTKKFVNISYIAMIEPSGDNCKVLMAAMPGRGDYPHYIFIAQQSYDTVMRLIVDNVE